VIGDCGGDGMTTFRRETDPSTGKPELVVRKKSVAD
jgi:hypothetical protein